MSNKEDPKKNAVTSTTFQNKAETFYSTLKTNFTSESTGSAPNFWQLACTFDTVLDYFWVMNYLGDTSANDDLPQAISDAKASYYRGIRDNMAIWYDDWCWMGIAFSKSFDPHYIDLFGDDVEFFQLATLDIWGLVNAGDFQTLAARFPAAAWTYTGQGANALAGNRGGPISRDEFIQRQKFHRGTTNTWRNIESGIRDDTDTDYTFFTTPGANWAKPRFLGGAWQYDMYSQVLSLPGNPQDGNAYNHPWPNGIGEPYQGPFQFTLMSGLHLVLASRLALATKPDNLKAISPSEMVKSRLDMSDTYKGYAEGVMAFLDQWFAVPDSDYSLFKLQGDDSLMVKERMPTYAACSQCETAHSPYTNGIHSEGGQQYPIVQGYDKGRYWGGDQGLIIGALMDFAALDADREAELRTRALNLVDGVFKHMVVDYVVQPYKGDFGDAGDYLSGHGIFWRYVLRHCRTDSEFLQHVLKAVTANPADNAVVDSALTPYSNQQTGSLFKPFNEVSVEIAAAFVLYKKENPS